MTSSLSDCIVFCTGGDIASVALEADPGHAFDDLQVDMLFPKGACSLRLIELPGTNLRLPNDWRIFLSRCQAEAPLNQAVQTRYGRKWSGNIVFALYSADGRGLSHITQDDVPFLVAILKW